MLPAIRIVAVGMIAVGMMVGVIVRA